MPATKRATSSRPPADTELVPAKASIETWQNDSAGIVAINRLGEYGRREVDIIQGGRRFQLTPQERRMNQNACASTDLDIFTNGTLRPIDLIDDEVDSEALKVNPNILSDEDLPKLFQLKGDQFVERIGQITNQSALSRILEMTRDSRFNATLAQYEAVKVRDRELNGELDRDPKPEPVTGKSGMSSLPRGVTPQ